MARAARVVAFSTTPDMAREIDRMAAELGSSRSKIMRAAFELYAQSQQHEPHADTPGYANGAPGGAALAAESSATFVSTEPSTKDYSLPGLATVLAHRHEIRELCRELGVRRLWLFGSAVRDDFEPGRSDFDFQVEWEPDTEHRPWAGELFDLQNGLSRIVGGQKVDLGEAGINKNPYVRAAIEGERLLIHESAG